jgi:hypothetical protein
MKKRLLTILFALAISFVCYAQTITYTANYYKIKFDATAATPVATAWPFYTAPAPSGIWLAEQITGAMRIKGDPGVSGDKAAYGVNFQWLLSDAALTQSQVSTPTTLPDSKKFEIRMKSVGSYTPQIAIQIQEQNAPYRTIDNLANITPTSTMTTYVVDLTDKLHSLYGNPGKLDSTKLNQIFIGVDHGVTTTYAQRQNVDLQIEFFKLGDSTTYVPPAPEISVTGNSTSIASGGTFDFTGIAVGNSIGPVSFTISNAGPGDLNLTGTPKITISGTDAAMFAVNQTATTTPVAASNNTSFSVTFTPTSGGVKTAVLTIANNDTDEGTYTVNLTGEGLVFPEINLKQGTTSITSGDSYDIGDVNSGSSGSPVTFTIENVGAGNLSLTGTPKVALSGAHAAMFSVNETATTSSIASTGTTTFTVTFSPTSTGTKTATLTIGNDDSNESSYTIVLIGESTTATSVTGALNNFISVYPNPSTNLVTVSTNGLEGSLKLTLKNEFGMEVKTISTDASTGAQLDISDLASGIYYLEIISPKGNGMKKIIKN